MSYTIIGEGNFFSQCDFEEQQQNIDFNKFRKGITCKYGKKS